MWCSHFLDGVWLWCGVVWYGYGVVWYGMVRYPRVWYAVHRMHDGHYTYAAVTRGTMYMLCHYHGCNRCRNRHCQCHRGHAYRRCVSVTVDNAIGAWVVFVFVIIIVIVIATANWRMVSVCCYCHRQRHNGMVYGWVSVCCHQRLSLPTSPWVVHVCIVIVNCHH